MNDSGRSYRQILRSSSILGGAQGLNYLVSLIRVKIVAVLLGPSGVGLVSVYISAIGLLSTVSGFGITSSGIREVAQAFNQQNKKAIAQTIIVLRRACWVTGLIGWAIAVALAVPLSTWVSGSSEHAAAIGLLGLTLLLGAINGGQTTLLQGMSRIGDIARANIITMLLNTGVAIGLYSLLGQQGIIPVLLVSSAMSLGVSWWFARKVSVDPIPLSFRDTFIGARRLVGLGLAFMWSGLLTSGLDMAIRSIVIRMYGISAAGLYQSAWNLSGFFASFILAAMGTDFYPRLSSVIHDHPIASQTVNEQTEIGVLLALPGLLGTLTFAPWLMEIFYSKQFLTGAELLPWFVLGIWGRIISWPMGYILVAKGDSRWYAMTETGHIALQLCLLLWAVPRFGLVGAAYAFAVSNFVYTVIMLWVSKRLIGFCWSKGVRRVLLMSGCFVMFGLGIKLVMLNSLGLFVGGGLTMVSFLLSLRGLARRVGTDHQLVRAIYRIPGAGWIFYATQETGHSK